jgi:O-antigen ligase
MNLKEFTEDLFHKGNTVYQKYTYAVLFLLLFPFFTPASVSLLPYGSYLTSFLAVCRYMISFAALYHIIYRVKLKKFCESDYFICMALAVLTQIIAMLFNGSLYITAALSCFTLIGFAGLNAALYFNNKKRLFKFYMYMAGIYILVNLAVMLLFPNGLDPLRSGDGRYYFLGTKNDVPPYWILFLFSYFQCCKYYKDTYKKYLSAVLIFLSCAALLNRSSTGLIAILMIDAYFLLSVFLKIIKTTLIKKIQWYYILFLFAVTLLFFVFGIVLKQGQNSVLGFLTGLIGKDFTFNGRKAIWDAAVEHIAANFFWGVGIDVTYDVWGNSVLVYSAHNFILDYAVKYGCISLLFYMAGMINVLVCACKQHFLASIRMALLCISGLLFCGMFEAIGNSYIFWGLICLMFLLVYQKSELPQRWLELFHKAKEKALSVKEKRNQQTEIQTMPVIADAAEHTDTEQSGLASEL